MFDCGYKSQYIGGQKEKFVRLDDFDSLSVTSSNKGMKKLRFNVDGFNISTGHEKKNASKSFRHEVKRGSKGLVTIGRSLKTGVARAVFLEDLKVSEKMIFDPQHKSLLLWNRLLVMSCILSVSIDPLFFYLPVFNYQMTCLGMDTKLAAAITTMRTTLDVFYLIRVALQFRTAYVAPSSRVFGRGELVIDPAQIASRYLSRYFIVDFLSVLPLPQIVVWKYLTNKKKGSEVLATKQALLIIVFSQYIPRFGRFFPLTSDLKKSAGSFAESALAGAAYYLLWYLLASHIAGAFWYLLAIERKGTCWREACRLSGKCNVDFLYCGNKLLTGYHDWRRISDKVLGNKCDVDKDDNSRFNYGIYFQAMSSDIVSSRKFVSKFFYCLWWGLQNLSTLGQGLQTSTYPLEVIFSILLAISGLILFALLIGNMQTYLQSLSVRLEEMRIKRRDSEQWMHHRLLPHDLRERVRKYDQYKWFETRGVDEENLVQNLPKDLRRDIKRHLCLNLVRRVPLFANMDERLLDAICERLKPSLYTEETYIVREGDPVDKMLFIIRGRLESVTTDGGRSGFFNRGVLKEGAFCGEELLTWALDPKSLGNLPLSTRTVGALTEVEAFALEAEELKFVASQFRRLHSRQVQHTFRFYSQQWRTWAACFIQTAWRRYSRRKAAELRRLEEEEDDDVDYDEEDEDDGDDDDERKLVGELDSAGLRATIFASRFAANALRGHKLRGSNSRGLKKLQKPPEPDFNEE
ncbi:putative cyclic nucleotide-gated ion channel 7 [Populus alba]|uniref:Cyclic nucleotide gated channel 7 family protein n=2 Tax=Populus TaxID=3689 RepID=A0A4U5PKE8_POPAL|nr:cyclic nucleotide gated channel 7 family protein [Populus alba x Populus x berolinensis]TKR97372.1 cyclic nucleotide gated channel 7 family protein [Populus alba]